DDNENWQTIDAGEMENGGSTLFEFEEPVEAKFFRLYIHETYGTPENKYASAAEIKVYTKNEGVADYSKLAPIYTAINSIDTSLYTNESLDASGFNDLLDEVNTTYTNPNASQEDIDDIVAFYEENIDQILEQLKEIPSDLVDLEAL